MYGHIEMSVSKLNSVQQSLRTICLQENSLLTVVAENLLVSLFDCALNLIIQQTLGSS